MNPHFKNVILYLVLKSGLWLENKQLECSPLGEPHETIDIAVNSGQAKA